MSQSTIFQLCRDGLMCLAKGHNAVTLVRLKPATPRSRVKHSTTGPLRSLKICLNDIKIP